MSLHLDRKKGQTIILEIEQIKKVEITFAGYDAETEKARFLIKAPKDVRIIRKELLHKTR